MCIACFSSKAPDLLELNPIDEVYSVLPEIVPEILDGKIDIISIARDKGVRTKIVVRAASGENPIRFFIGKNGENVQKLKTLLSTEEEIDFVLWTVVPEQLIMRALYPLREEEVVRIDIDNLNAKVFVKSQDLIRSAIGTKGVIVRLAQQVTNYTIDIDHEVSVISLEDEVIKLTVKYIPSEIYDEIEIIKVARIPDSLTKVFLFSKTMENPAQICGNAAYRNPLVRDLGEQIQFIEWNEEPTIQIKNALSLSTISLSDIENIYFDPLNSKKAIVEVSSHQAMRDAIGRNGVNVKVASILTGYNITIRMSE